MKQLKQSRFDALEYWRNGAADDLDTAEKLFASKKYHHSLFFLHLAIEKLLKAIHQKRRNEPAPPIHNLNRLAELSGLSMDDKLDSELREISTFNISARYNDYKYNFYKKATLDYSRRWLDTGKRLYNKFLLLL